MLTTVAAGRVFDYSYCIGMYSTSGVGFLVPHDFALRDGVLYVVNRGVDEITLRINKCTVDHQFIGEFSRYGTGDGQFIWPSSIDLDQAGNIYVSDENLNRIQVFDNGGKFLGKWGTPGSGEGQLSGPCGIAFDADDNLLVVDSLNHRVQKFSKDGKFLATWRSQGAAPGQFNTPWGICLDSKGDVYVADWKNNRVQKFSAGGRFLAQFGQPGSCAGELNRPTSVAVDSDGDVYVTDWGSDQVKIYGPEGKYITCLVGDAQVPSPWVQDYINANPDVQKARRRTNLETEWRFRRPVAINVDEQGQIFVLESVRHRLQVYHKERDYVEAALNL